MTLRGLPAFATITDITLRDGLQSLPRTYSIGDKRGIFEALVRAGFRSIEVTSFMRPDRVPQLADAQEFVASVDHPETLEFRALVANRRGVERAIGSGIDVISVLVTLSDEYCRRNQGVDHASNLALACEVIRIARDAGRRTDVSYSMPIFCPYEGPIAPERLADATDALLEAGADAFTICTSTGLEGPSEVAAAIDLVRDRSGRAPALHLHDTNGMAAAVALTGLLEGVERFETALGGVGGGIALPSGMPSHGNYPTEDMVHLLAESGVETGLETEAAAEAARAAGSILGRPPVSRAAIGATKGAIMKMTGGSA